MRVPEKIGLSFQRAVMAGRRAGHPDQRVPRQMAGSVADHDDVRQVGRLVSDQRPVAVTAPQGRSTSSPDTDPVICSSTVLREMAGSVAGHDRISVNATRQEFGPLVLDQRPVAVTAPQGRSTSSPGTDPVICSSTVLREMAGSVAGHDRISVNATRQEFGPLALDQRPVALTAPQGRSTSSPGTDPVICSSTVLREMAGSVADHDVISVNATSQQFGPSILHQQFGHLTGCVDAHRVIADRRTGHPLSDRAVADHRVGAR